MKRLRIVSIGATVMAAMLAATGARADYESRPDLLPINRCPSSVLPKDCQALYWDLPAATFEGQQELGAPDPTTGYRHGITDRPPPLYTDGTNGFGHFFMNFHKKIVRNGRNERFRPLFHEKIVRIGRSGLFS